MRKPPLVEVRWLDAVHRSESASVEDARNDTLATRVTVGFLIYQGPDRTVLAMTYDPPGTAGLAEEVDGRFTIPTGWIIGPIRYIERKPREGKADGPGKPPEA